MVDPPWWDGAVFYEVYPRSFQDSDGDGVGDLNGILSRLDYLRDLGVDAIWITPFYPSPQIDFGYDISDFANVDPQFGKLDDFDRLLQEAHARGIRVVTDLVLNHTSDQHPWFVASRSSRESPYRDWYVWRDGEGSGPPNNWVSIFEPTAWTRDASGQFYYHAFYAEQPDLNLRHPDVRRALGDVVRFWLERGVDGFRLDAIAHLYEDGTFRDNPWRTARLPGGDGERSQEHRHTMFHPECHDFLRFVREVTDEYADRVLISEAYVEPEGLRPYYASVHLPFNFALMGLREFNATAIRAVVEQTADALSGRPTTWVLNNHDQPRSIDRFAATAPPERLAKAMALVLLGLRGTPFLYYGEEIGMVTTDPERVEDVRDPLGRRYWPENKGRDGERTPMQWDATLHGGFTDGQPWLPVPVSSAVRNVARMQDDENSILAFYRRLLALRRENPVLRYGSYETMGTNPDVFVWRRRWRGDELWLAINTATAPRMFTLPSSGSAVMLSNVRSEGHEVGRDLELGSLEAMVLRPPTSVEQVELFQ